MPAYYRDIVLPKCNTDGCNRPASREVFTHNNAKFGDYCKPHASVIVDDLNTPAVSPKKTATKRRSARGKAKK